MIVFSEFLSTVKHSASEWIAQFWRDRTTLLIVVLAGLGAAHVLVRTATYGASVQMGSVTFLSTAINFLAGEGWRHFTGNPMTAWPPLFPLLLAVSGWVGIDPVAAGRWINAIAFGLTILVAGCWLRSNLRSRWLALAATAALTASLPLNKLAAHLETAPIFVLLTLLALIQLASFLNRRTDAPLWWAAIFTALAATIRYQGVALIGTSVLILLLTARLKQTLIFGVISSVPLLAVLTRNWVATGDLTRVTGNRTEASGQPLADGLSQAIEVFHEWIVPSNTPDGFAYLLGLAVAAVVLASAAVILRGRQPDPEAAPAYLHLRPVLPLGAFALSYLVFIITVMPLTVRLGVDSRYLLPMYVPLLLTAVFLLDRFLSIKATSWMGAVRYGLAALVVLATLTHVGFSTRKNLRITAKAYVAGYEKDWMYNTAYWQQSETLNYLRDNHIDSRIYSNNRELAWFARRAADPGKHRSIPGEMRWPNMEVGAHIVWFDRFYNRAFRTHDDTDIRVLSGVEVVAELADGLVLRRTAVEPFDAKKHRARKQRYMNQLIQQADEQVVRAGWNVYRTGRRLTYLKEPCAPADVQAKFILHVVPTDPADLRADRQQYDSDNLDFYFYWRGERVGDQCTAIIRLPPYPIRRIHIGQWISEEDRTLWEAEFSPSR